MIKKSSSHAGVRSIVLSSAPLLSLLLILSVMLSGAAYAESEETLCFIAINDAELDNSGCGIEETLPGDIYADAVRKAAGTDLAVVSAGVFGEKRLTHGRVVLSGVKNSLTRDMSIVTASVTAPELKSILEEAVSGIVLDMETEAVLREESHSARFLQISGFTMVCDASAPAGDRIMSVTAGGEELDLTDGGRVFTLAADEDALAGFGADAETGYTLSEALVRYLPELDGLTEYPMGRISIVGTTDDRLIDDIPIWAVAFAAVFFTMAALLLRRAKERE